MYFKSISPKYLLAAATMALLFAACGGQSDSAPSATVSSPTAVPAATQAQAIPTATQAQAEATATKSGDTSASTTTPTAAVASVTKINLNTATAEQILTVPNAGNRMVREFQEYRPYASIAEFRKELGKYIDAAQISDYEKYQYITKSNKRVARSKLDNGTNAKQLLDEMGQEQGKTFEGEPKDVRTRTIVAQGKPDVAERHVGV